MTYVIAQPCVDVKDRACIEECPVDAIYEGPRGTYVNPQECIDCGACAVACPAEAIFFEGELPEKWRPWAAANAEFFEITGLGAAGGYSRVGEQDIDHPLVESVVEAGA